MKNERIKMVLHGIEVSTLGNFRTFDERYYIMEDLTKAQVDEVVRVLNENTKIKTTLDTLNPKDFIFDAITAEEVWAIVKKYSAGCTDKYIAEYIQCRREEEYKKITGRYAEKTMKFPKSRVNEVIKLINKG
jgi:hypothetical protein